MVEENSPSHGEGLRIRRTWRQRRCRQVTSWHQILSVRVSSWQKVNAPGHSAVWRWLLAIEFCFRHKVIFMFSAFVEAQTSRITCEKFDVALQNAFHIGWEPIQAPSSADLLNVEGGDVVHRFSAVSIACWVVARSVGSWQLAALFSSFHNGASSSGSGLVCKGLAVECRE